MLKKWGLLGQADMWRGPESCRSPCSPVTLAHILGQASPFPPPALGWVHGFLEMLFVQPLSLDSARVLCLGKPVLTP